MPTGIFDRSKSEACQRYYARKRIDMLGSNNPMFGKHRTEEEKSKISKNRIGLNAGPSNHKWKGGITKLKILIRKSKRYKRWRLAIMERDNYTCKICAKRGGDLNVDHFPVSFAELLGELGIVDFHQAITCEELWNVVDNRTLCVECHKKTFMKGGDAV